MTSEWNLWHLTGPSPQWALRIEMLVITGRPHLQPTLSGRFQPHPQEEQYFSTWMSHGAFKWSVNTQIFSPEFSPPVFPVLADGPAHPCCLSQKQHKGTLGGRASLPLLQEQAALVCFQRPKDPFPPQRPSSSVRPPLSLPGLQQHSLHQHHCSPKIYFWCPPVSF